ncbi:MAG: hypothetical protein ABIG84_05450 [archaeon]
MSLDCKICNDKLHQGSKNLVLCEHKQGFVHLGCCSNNCSQHGAPCSHAIADYRKTTPVRVSPELFSLFG